MRGMDRLISAAACALLFLGCGPGVDRPGTLRELQAAMHETVSTPGTRASHNELVKRVAEASVLEGMTRDEVRNLIGRGTDCSASQLCLEQEFEADDWVYQVGVEPQTNFGHVPTLIVGFDTLGKVARTWYRMR